MPLFNVRLALSSVDEDRLLLGRVQVSRSAVRGNAIVFRQLETTRPVSFPCAADRGPVPVSEIMFRLMTYVHEDGRFETCVSVVNREEADTIPGFMTAVSLTHDNFTITVGNAPELTERQRAELDAGIGRRMGQRFIDEMFFTPAHPRPPKPRTAPNCLRLVRRAVDI